MDSGAGIDQLFKPQPIIRTYLDHFYRDPVLMDLPHFRELDVYRGSFAFQPQSNFHKFPWSEPIRSGELTTGFREFEDASVRLKLRAHIRQHAVNREIRAEPTGLVFSLRHTGMCRVVREEIVWLFLKSGGIPKRVVRRPVT